MAAKTRPTSPTRNLPSSNPVNELDRAGDLAVDDTVELVEKQRLINLMVERNKLVKDNGIEFYRPHWKQHLFHSHADIRWRYMRSGNRGGKSQCGVAEDISMALGERRFYKHKFDVIDGTEIGRASCRESV